MAAGALVGIVFGMMELSKSSKWRKYQVVKEAMLQPITVKPFEYGEVSVPEHVQMLHELVFSKRPELCLIEGAQGRSWSFLTLLEIHPLFDLGTGKTTLVQKLLNERITKDHVPCYYWSLKDYGSKVDYSDLFLNHFGVSSAMSDGKLAEKAVNNEILARAFHQLRVESGAPCVLVIDDAQVRFLLLLLHSIIVLFSVCSLA